MTVAPAASPPPPTRARGALRVDESWSGIASEPRSDYDPEGEDSGSAGDHGPSSGRAATSGKTAGRADSEMAATGKATGDDVDQLDRVLAERVAGLDELIGGTTALEDLGCDELRSVFDSLQRLEGLTTCVMARTVAALDDAGEVADDGAPSTTEYLKRATGKSGRESARLSRLARRLPDRPATAAALTAGAISAEVADIITKAVARESEEEDRTAVERDLLARTMTHSPRQLRQHIRRRQQAKDGNSLRHDEKQQHARRSLRVNQLDNGMTAINGLLPAEAGNQVTRLLQAFDKPLPAHGADGENGGSKGGRGSAGDGGNAGDGEDATPADRRPSDKRLADALIAATKYMLDHGMTPASGGTARPHLNVTVPLGTVQTDLANTDGDGPVGPGDQVWADLPAGVTDDGTALSPQAIRRLLCDAAVTRVVVDGRSMPLDVGRSNRNWSGAQRVAINVRDRQCRGPNCSRPITWTNIHHIRWWERDLGDTAVDNGMALCSFCHHLVHDKGWTVHLDTTDATATWTSPKGRVKITKPPPSAPEPPDSSRSRPPASQNEPAEFCHLRAAETAARAREFCHLRAAETAARAREFCTVREAEAKMTPPRSARSRAGRSAMPESGVNGVRHHGQE